MRSKARLAQDRSAVEERLLVESARLKRQLAEQAEELAIVKRWHVAKTGDQFAALQPLSMGLKQRYYSVTKDVARGLNLRMDNGSQFLSEHFQIQIKFWGIAPSFAFVAQPETNGVMERFNKALKEQIIHGRQYRNAEELQAAAGAFVETYNRHWLLEKLGFKSPWQAWQEFDDQLFKAGA